MSTFDDDVFVRMANQHSENAKNERINQVISNYGSVEDLSVNNTRTRYSDKKKYNTNKVRAAKIAIVLAAALAFGAGALVTNAVVNERNVVISKTDETKNFVDERISHYEKLMGIYGEDNNRIETFHSRDVSTYELNVSYNNDNLAKTMYEASQVSESELRCVVIAAFRIINEPYREDVLKSAFNILKTNYSLPSNLEDLAGNGLDGFLNFLDYKDLDDYRMNERDSIKELRVVEEYINKGMGR